MENRAYRIRQPIAGVMLLLGVIVCFQNCGAGLSAFHLESGGNGGGYAGDYLPDPGPVPGSDVNQTDPELQTNPVPVHRFIQASTGDYQFAASANDPGINGYDDLGLAFTMAPGSTRLIYNCYDSLQRDHFLSYLPSCEGRILVGTVGRVSPVASSETPLQLIRCFVKGHHRGVTSADLSACESDTNSRVVLGYVF